VVVVGLVWVPKGEIVGQDMMVTPEGIEFEITVQMRVGRFSLKEMKLLGRYVKESVPTREILDG
jgi:hypothetical protein